MAAPTPKLSFSLSAFGLLAVLSSIIFLMGSFFVENEIGAHQEDNGRKHSEQAEGAQ